MRYHKIGIQIANKNHDFIINIPQSKDRYTVEFLVDDISWGSTRDLEYYSEKDKKEVKYVPSKDDEKLGKDRVSAQSLVFLKSHIFNFSNI